MSDAPSWLTEENVSTATTLAKNPVVQKQAKKAASNPAVQKAAKDQIKKEMGYTPPVADNAPGWANGQQADVETGGSARPKSTADASASTEFIIDELTLKNMQNYHLALRILYIGASVSLAAAAALSLENQNDVGLVFIAFYVLFFSILICCFEAAISMVSRMIATNFGFMYTLSGRALFLLFVGFLSYSLSLYGKINMGILYAVGLFQCYIMWKFPRFEEYLRKKHYFEGKSDE